MIKLMSPSDVLAFTRSPLRHEWSKFYKLHSKHIVSTSSIHHHLWLEPEMEEWIAERNAVEQVMRFASGFEPTIQFKNANIHVEFKLRWGYLDA